MVFFTKFHGSAGCGGANLRDPRGGLAKGTPRKMATGCADPSKLTYLPRTLPCTVSTTGGEDGCPPGHPEERGHISGKRSDLDSWWVFHLEQVTLNESPKPSRPGFLPCKERRLTVISYTGPSRGANWNWRYNSIK